MQTWMNADISDIKKIVDTYMYTLPDLCGVSNGRPCVLGSARAIGALVRERCMDHCNSDSISPRRIQNIQGLS